MRNGKIARLPVSVRNELNPRMERGESGETILEWLNGLPVVRTLVKEDFEGAPISKQNLYEWRQGGFREWEMTEDMLSAAVRAKGMNGEIDVLTLIGDLLAMIAARYARIMMRWDGEHDPEFEAKARMLGKLLRNFIAIQKNVQAVEKPKEKKKPVADDLDGLGGGEVLKQLQELMAGKVEKSEQSGTAGTKPKMDCSGGTLLRADATEGRPLLREDPSSRGRPGGQAAKADKQVTLPATVAKAGLPNVVELKALGLDVSGRVKPGKTGSNQKIDFSAAEASVYAKGIS
jgi:hypothetical protein